MVSISYIAKVRLYENGRLPEYYIVRSIESFMANESTLQHLTGSHENMELVSFRHLR